MDVSFSAFLTSCVTALSSTHAFEAVSAALDAGVDATLTIPAFVRALFVAVAFLKKPRSFLIVLPTENEARKFQTQLAAYVGVEHALLLPARHDIPWGLHGADLGVMSARSRAIHAIAAGEPSIVVTSVAAAMWRVPAPQTNWCKPLYFAPNCAFDFNKLLRDLTQRGYRRQKRADEEGTFSLLGDVLSVYPPYPQRPFRVDFFDDEIETVKTWVVGSGQQVAALEKAELYAIEEPGKTLVPLAHYVKPQTYVMLVEPKALFDCALKYEQELHASAKAAAFTQPLSDSFLSPAQLDFGGRARLTLATLTDTHAADAQLKARRPATFSSDDQFLIALRELLNKDFTVTIALPLRRHRERIKELLVFAGISIDEQGNTSVSTRAVRIIDLDLSFGWIVPVAGIALLTTAEIYPRASATHRADLDRLPPGTTGSLSELDPTKLTFAFNPGDYVVHSSYGIALFKRIERRTVEGITRDYLCLAYADGDTLYTPVDQIDKLSKYVGADGNAPRVTKLGGKMWARATSKARSAAKQLAFDLAQLYARRSHIRGYAFGTDTMAQAEMEAAFPYEETPDQHAAIADVKADMESERPMDRLIIGDVGYGKTEVALRAAFKAAQDGKQVLVLCPTTILAQQHFTEFSERFAPFDVQVEVLSRFRTPKQQRIALEGFAAGTVAVLVGTHRLLSADVIPHDLGLLIIDEEQRFGVGAKEQLKHMREQIDVLAMSATPIPRTLQMSLSGVRDLSVIDTPPAGRSAVKVHVGAYSEELASAAIRRELHRHGQVYYVSNRVKTIDDALARVHEAAPEARVGVAHGQMSEHQLEDVMERFVAGEIEVLVSTTIVESGIDNPHTNTLIIEDAQRLGLAQLYQLKGRVGRSHTHAYAYFLYPPTVSLTPEALERLTAIAEHDELGSGIKIALRDLEIRGAGSIIGSAQSGQLAAVGFDLFAGMLQAAVAETRGHEQVVYPEIRIDLDVPAYLPDEYLPDVAERILWYRRIAAAHDDEALALFRVQLIASAGALPEVAENIFTLAAVRLLAGELGAKSVEVKAGEVRIAALIKDQTVLDLLPQIGVHYAQGTGRGVGSSPMLTKALTYGENVAKAAEVILRAIVCEDV